ncbi:hypothetical protein QR680_014842 [Steinernema hermaphroditum]|uniref:Uncharacterized protein n=2 Tax=Steinernema hermaphroditum TaxID=289476 RepID=A0AA39IAA9_9BILA|nr:hypothetical protein QR680_014842 [Steinernema hermaphroditum]
MVLMFFSVPLFARPRKDRRPLYRRIFTNRRLDIAHKVVVRSIFGFLLFSTSYIVVNSVIYYKPVSTSTNKTMDAARRILFLAANKWPYTFGLGVAAGASFELFKIYFSFNGVSYYSVFKKKQLAKELDEFERGLMEMDALIADSLKAKASSQ